MFCQKKSNTCRYDKRRARAMLSVFLMMPLRVQHVTHVCTVTVGEPLGSHTPQWARTSLRVLLMTRKNVSSSREVFHDRSKWSAQLYRYYAWPATLVHHPERGISWSLEMVGTSDQSVTAAESISLVPYAPTSQCNWHTTYLLYL